MTTSEKEEAVIELIYNTPAKVRPGVRNLPFYLYAENEIPPPVRDIDDDGLPAIGTDEETTVVRASKAAEAKRKKGDISMPSTSALMPDPHTDSERSSRSSSKRRTPDSVSDIDMY